MRVKIRATGQIEDFDPAFARRAIECGMAESLEKVEKSGMPEKATAETASLVPSQGTATVAAPRKRWQIFR